jgi:hypothetical protein
MTTKVTVDAHAGWPVEVTVVDNIGEKEDFKIEIVQPNTIKDFFVFDTRHLIIKEMKKQGV